ncbi:MAG TPA: ATP synthase subunit I, partial [Candidatus Acidoferrales bacterium]|nr:ATP synthase subunit I [Candidatus Acidoferrales bacterium]
MHPDRFSPTAVKQRIERGVVVTGVLVTAIAGYFGSAIAAGAAALGTGLAWLNFRWLKQGLDAIEQVSSVQEGAARTRIPKGVLARFFARFALILVVLYASLAY